MEFLDSAMKTPKNGGVFKGKGEKAKKNGISLLEKKQTDWDFQSVRF